jgi:CheY-like chemotaxis protein
VAIAQSTKRSQVVVPQGLKQVLILDDERFDRHRLARLCSGLDFACEITNAKTLGEFETHITDAGFDLILVDYSLPDGTGIDALAMVHSSAQNHKAATIMITGQGKAAVAQDAITGGCCDYLNKDDLSPQNFSYAVLNALQKTIPRAKPNARNYPHADVEAIVEHFASQCAQDMKPMVSRMMRLVRDLRARSGGEIGEAAPLGAIEDSCVNIWEFLIALERSSGAQIIADTLPGGNEIQKLAEDKPIRKPPSPFSKAES